jgi:hypothetical protein
MLATLKLKLPKSLWTARDSARLAANTVAAIKLRTSKGLDADNKPFKRYSTRPIYISKNSTPKPKRGRRWTIRRPRRRLRTVFYQGGYEEYKKLSRQHNANSSALVDLVGSGVMLNNLVVLHADAKRFVIGMTYNVRHYAYAVNAERKFLGLSPDDVNMIVSAVEHELMQKLKRRGQR